MLCKYSSTYFLLGAVCLLSASATDLPSNFTSTNCVAPNGFDTCFQAAQAKAQRCIDASGGSEDIAFACSCVMWLDEINCAASDCWNEVYSCQYQSLIVNYMRYCPATDGNFPYFPAPANAPGGCSCNLGEVYLNAVSSFQEAVTKCKNPTSIDEGTACYCCMEASALTSVYGICPSTDPSLIGLHTIESQLGLFDVPFSNCGPYLEKYDCVKDLGFSPVGTASFVQPSDLTSSGTETLYTTGAQITAPVSGEVLTWSHANGEYTASAADGGSVHGQSTSGSGTAASGSPTGKSSASRGYSQNVAVGGVFVLGVGIAII